MIVYIVNALIVGFLIIGLFGVMAFVYRMTIFYLTIWFGKNIRITTIDSQGMKSTKKYRLDNLE